MLLSLETVPQSRDVFNSESRKLKSRPFTPFVMVTVMVLSRGKVGKRVNYVNFANKDFG